MLSRIFNVQSFNIKITLNRTCCIINYKKMKVKNCFFFIRMFIRTDLYLHIVNEIINNFYKLRNTDLTDLLLKTGLGFILILFFLINRYLHTLELFP